MSFKIDCPSCYLPQTVDERDRGYEVRCRDCDHRFRVPRKSGGSMSADSILTGSSQEDDRDREGDRYEERGRRRGDRKEDVWADAEDVDRDERPRRSERRSERRPREDDRDNRGRREERYEDRGRRRGSSSRGGDTWDEAEDDPSEDRPRGRADRRRGPSKGMPVGVFVGMGISFVGLIVACVCFYFAFAGGDSDDEKVAKKDDSAEKKEANPNANANANANPDDKAKPNPNPPVNPKPPTDPKKKETPKKPKVEPKKPKTVESELVPDVWKTLKAASVLVRVRGSDGTPRTGSGFLAHTPGLVMTNIHVLGMLKHDSAPPEKIEVVCHSGEPGEKTLVAELAGIDLKSQVAVLKIPKDGLPKPLTFQSAQSVKKDTKLYVTGFPGGGLKGAKVSIKRCPPGTSRAGQFGKLLTFQLESGVDAGNSGGPVVTSAGHVVGIAVAATPQFAIASDIVEDALAGKVAYVHITEKGGTSLKADVKVSLFDPLDKIDEVAVHYWLGNPTRHRQPPTTAPKQLKGEGSIARQELSLAGQTATGQISFPRPCLPFVQTIWVQPELVRKAGTTVYAKSWRYPPDSWQKEKGEVDPPESKPKLTQIATKLEPENLPRSEKAKTIQITKGPNPQLFFKFARTVQIKAKHELSSPNAMGGTRKGEFEFDATIQELAGVDRGTKTPYFVLAYTNPLPKLKLPSWFEEKDRKKYLALGADFRNIATIVRFDLSGKVKKTEIKVGNNLLEKAVTEKANKMILGQFDAFMIPLPNNFVDANHTWTNSAAILLQPMSEKTTTMSFTYKYVGFQKREKHPEAIIEIRGEIDPANEDHKVAAKAAGYAIIDLKIGEIVDMELKVVGKEVKADPAIDGYNIFSNQMTLKYTRRFRGYHKSDEKEKGAK